MSNSGHARQHRIMVCAQRVVFDTESCGECSKSVSPLCRPMFASRRRVGLRCHSFFVFSFGDGGRNFKSAVLGRPQRLSSRLRHPAFCLSCFHFPHPAPSRDGSGRCTSNVDCTFSLESTTRDGDYPERHYPAAHGGWHHSR